MAKYDVGEVIEDTGIFGNMSKEGIKMTCVEASGVESKFDVEYFGVKLGQAFHVDEPTGEFWDWRG